MLKFKVCIKPLAWCVSVCAQADTLNLNTNGSNRTKTKKAKQTRHTQQVFPIGSIGLSDQYKLSVALRKSEHSVQSGFFSKIKLKNFVFFKFMAIN